MSGLALVGITGLGDLQVSQIGADVELRVDAGTFVLVQNTTLAQMDAADFIF